MAIGDLTRINTNIAALNALNSLKTIGNQLGVTQQRLQTTKRVNEAADDPSGFSMISKLNSRARGLATALDSVGTSQNMLAIAEGAATTIHDDLLTIQDLARSATSDNLGTSERAAIKNQITDLGTEIDRLRNSTTFNGQSLINGTFTGKRVLTGSEASDTILMSITQDFSLASLGIAAASIAVDTTANASLTLTYVDAALTSVRLEIQSMGSLGSRLRGVTDNLSIAVVNTKSAASRIQDADVAAEQVNAVRLQIMQQLATAQLSAANSAPQQILALFR